MSTIPNSAITGTNKNIWKVSIYALLAGLLIIFVLSWYNADSNYRLGEKYFKDKNYTGAVLAFEQCVLNDFPGSPYREKAIKYLFTIGDLSYRQKDIAAALQAYQAVLFAEGSLSVYRNPSASHSKLAMEKIRTIHTDWVAATMPHKFPSRFWSLVSGLSLLFWILTIFLFIRKGFDKNGRLLTPPAYFHMGSFVLLLGLWIVAILNL